MGGSPEPSEEVLRDGRGEGGGRGRREMRRSGRKSWLGNDLAEGGGQGCVCARVTSSEETES